jgi:hypothetical protein
MMMWSQCAGHLFLRNPGADDLELIESEQGLQVGGWVGGGPCATRLNCSNGSTTACAGFVSCSITPSEPAQLEGG